MNGNINVDVCIGSDENGLGPNEENVGSCGDNDGKGGGKGDGLIDDISGRKGKENDALDADNCVVKCLFSVIMCLLVKISVAGPS